MKQRWLQRRERTTVNHCNFRLKGKQAKEKLAQLLSLLCSSRLASSLASATTLLSFSFSPLMSTVDRLIATSLLLSTFISRSRLLAEPVHPSSLGQRYTCESSSKSGSLSVGASLALETTRPAIHVTVDRQSSLPLLPALHPVLRVSHLVSIIIVVVSSRHLRLTVAEIANRSPEL